MEKLVQEAHELMGVDLSPDHISALHRYQRELSKWSKRVSLTAITDPEKVRIKHFLDSLSCLLVMRGTPVRRVIDVGTGAGFPGLPLKIVCPRIRLTLVESVGKKVQFCHHIVDILQLEGVEILQERVEKVGKMPPHRERYDWAIARAVVAMPALAEYLLPLVRIGGKMLAYKGESGPAEAHAAERALRLLGGHLSQIVPVTLPGVSEERYLVVVDKVAATPAKYPRRVGIPAKRPL